MVIYQALHGYEQGHNKLASSINLTLKNDNLMRVMSDWTGFVGLTKEDSSYITCYPLPDGDYYVIAKTWYAEEMPRPGCVWTHSLILDLSKVDDTLDFRILQRYFKRPKQSNYQDYFKTIIDTGKAIINENKENVEESLSIGQIEFLLYNLANRKNIQLRIEKVNSFYQNLCLGIIQYLPIDILKDLSFCTGTDYNSNIDSRSFNLSFNYKTPELLSAVHYSEDSSYEVDAGVHYWANSVKEQNGDDKLVKIFSYDIKDSVYDFWITGWLLSTLDNVKLNINNIKYKDILSLIAAAYPNKSQGKFTKEVFLNYRIASLYVNNKEYCSILCTSLKDSIVDWRKLKLDSYILSYLNDFDKQVDFMNYLINYVDVNEIGKEVLKKESFQFSDEELMLIAKDNWNVFEVILNYNHSILQKNWWIELDREELAHIVPLLFEYLDINFTSWNKLLAKCIRDSVACKDEYAKKIYINSTDAATIVLNYIYEVNYKNIIHGFLSSLLEDTNGILEWLKQTPQINSNITFFIIDNLNPQNSKIVNFGSTAWQSFYDFDKNGPCIISYYIFELLLSLNWKDNLSLKMLKTSFYNVYNALAHSKLELPQIEQLSSYMAELPIWQSWDNCKKLCRGTVKRLKELGYKKSTVKNLTLSEDVNKELMKAWRKLEKK